MKRSDEIEANANRLSAGVASALFPRHATMRDDINLAITFLRQYASETRAKEYAAEHGNGGGPPLPATDPAQSLAG